MKICVVQQYNLYLYLNFCFYSIFIFLLFI